MIFFRGCAFLKDNHIFNKPDGRAMLKRNGKYMRPALIGTGNQDLRGFLTLLKENGYDRWITLESSDPDRVIPIADALKGNVELVKRWEQEIF